MEKVQYTLYLRATINFVRSLIIVSVDQANAINKELMEEGIEIDFDHPETWKYYMNLNGEYHPSDGDPIVVISRDTYTPIELTKENMIDHPLTRESYLTHTTAYKELIGKYPNMDTLIRGVLDPIPLDKSINAKNYSILGWESRYIESNEHDLINNIQDYIDAYIVKYHNASYIAVDNLYLASLMGVLYLWLVPVVLTVRLGNCKTNKAHSFHIWSLLGGYGKLDARRHSLTKEQSLYLYRNIAWINANVGSTDVFTGLMRTFLTNSGIPLYGYDVRHEDSEVLNSFQYDVLATRYRLDDEINVANLTSTKPLSDFVNSMASSARDNPRILDYSYREIKEAMEASRRNIYPTKVLESEIVSGVENEEIEFAGLVTGQWVSMSCTGRYTATIELVYLPAGISAFFKPHEALALFIYAASKAFGTTLINIPRYKIQSHRRFEELTYEDLRALSVTVTDKWIRDLIDLQVPINTAPSIISFSELCIKLRRSVVESRLAYSRLTRIHERAEGELLANAHWSPGFFTLPTSEETYTEFFDNKLIDTDLLTTEACVDLVPVIYRQVTGFNYNASTIFNSIQADMLGLMEELSSYNVQYVGSFLFASATPVRWCLFRCDGLGVSIILPIYYIHITIIRILLLTEIEITKLDARTFTIKPSAFDSEVYTYEKFDTSVRIDLYNHVSTHDTIKLLSSRIVGHEVH